LGFRPDGLIRSRPDPKQAWKLPVKDWIRELHSERFGCVLGEKPGPSLQPTPPIDDEEATRRYWEELYWEDYWERNRNEQPARHRPVLVPSAPATAPADDYWRDKTRDKIMDEIKDEDIPF
jgi:hypothetical protein